MKSYEFCHFPVHLADKPLRLTQVMYQALHRVRHIR